MFWLVLFCVFVKFSFFDVEEVFFLRKMSFWPRSGAKKVCLTPDNWGCRPERLSNIWRQSMQPRTHLATHPYTYALIHATHARKHHTRTHARTHARITDTKAQKANGSRVLARSATTNSQLVRILSHQKHFYTYMYVLREGYSRHTREGLLVPSPACILRILTREALLYI